MGYNQKYIKSLTSLMLIGSFIIPKSTGNAKPLKQITINRDKTKQQIQNSDSLEKFTHSKNQSKPNGRFQNSIPWKKLTYFGVPGVIATCFLVGFFKYSDKNVINNDAKELSSDIRQPISVDKYTETHDYNDEKHSSNKKEPLSNIRTSVPEDKYLVERTCNYNGKEYSAKVFKSIGDYFDFTEKNNLPREIIFGSGRGINKCCESSKGNRYDLRSYRHPYNYFLIDEEESFLSDLTLDINEIAIDDMNPEKWDAIILEYLPLMCYERNNIKNLLKLLKKDGTLIITSGSKKGKLSICEPLEKIKDFFPSNQKELMAHWELSENDVSIETKCIELGDEYFFPHLKGNGEKDIYWLLIKK